jgi:YegS/Rv2252/BmrU family lipid kinase
MAEPVKVILNPYAGRGRGGQASPRIRTALTQAGISFDLVETTGVGHAIDLARQARLDGFTTVVAAGGDGTVSEVVNGLAQATPEGQPVGNLGLLPVGTANDFADMLGCSRDLHQAARAIAAGRTRRIDLGYTSIHTSAATVNRYFNNNIGVGFEAWVTLESYKVKWLTGTLLYIVAALRALRTCPTPYVNTTWVAANGEVHRCAQRTLMISIGNNSRTGGGFYLNPQAKMDDGLIDVGIAAAVSRWRILRLLPKALQGKHTSDPAMTMLRCHKLQIEVAEPLPMHVDGEVVARTAERIEVSVQPGRLMVIV